MMLAGVILTSLSHAFDKISTPGGTLTIYANNAAVNSSSNSITLIKAGAIADATGLNHSPGWIAIQSDKVMSAGAPDMVTSQLNMSEVTQIIDWPDQLVLPAMVNCHAHLDLTLIGAIPHHPQTNSFMTWLQQVISLAPREKEVIRQAVYSGIEMSLAQGVGYLGDIAGSATSADCRVSDGRLRGTSFIETFGLTATKEQITPVLKKIQASASHATNLCRIGLQPHAPYSAGKKWYELASRSKLPVSSHLAETKEELEFSQTGSGPFLDMLISLDKPRPDQPLGEHPVTALSTCLKRTPWILAHCNYLNETQIRCLSETDCTVAYCPIASDYFGHKNHSYLALLAAGVNCALGSDSILCQPKEASQPMSMLEQMRHLYHRDKADPAALLAMCTTNGHQALKSSDADGTIMRPGGLIHVHFDAGNPIPPLQQVLESAPPISQVFWLNEL